MTALVRSAARHSDAFCCIHSSLILIFAAARSASRDAVYDKTIYYVTIEEDCISIRSIIRQSN